MEPPSVWVYVKGTASAVPKEIAVRSASTRTSVRPASAALIFPSTTFPSRSRCDEPVVFRHTWSGGDRVLFPARGTGVVAAWEINGRARL